MKQILLTQHNKKTIYKEMKQTLEHAGLVIAPSDSVYGALVDATNQKAVKTLISFKKRPPGKPISVFVSDMKMFQEHAFVSKEQKAVLHRILPGPFTVVLPSQHKLMSLLESEDKTIGLRYPDYPFITDFIAFYGKPVTATSANLSSRPPHYAISSLLHGLPQYKQDMIDLIIDAGQLPQNKPSTVIDLSGEKIQTLRAGDIEYESHSGFITRDPEQTHKTGAFIAKQILENEALQRPIIFILHGPLGAGKTQFVKGMGSYLNISDIISPTYVISYEYDISYHTYFDTFMHVDLYNIISEEELAHIGLINSLEKKIICIEWGEKMGSYLSSLKDHAQVYDIDIQYVSETARSISIKKISS